MATKRYEIDMTQGSILKNMIRFAIPLMLTNLLQQFYNAADTIIVGRWAGYDALAAVGATSSLTNLLISLFIGISIGVSVLVSRNFGAGDAEGVKRSSHTAVALSFVCGLMSMMVGEILCRPILELLGTPGDVIDLSVLYMRIIFVGVPAQLVYNFGAAILRSVGDTKRPLYILSVTGIINVAANLFLVIGFNMSVAGVAIATAFAHYLSAFAVMYCLMYSDAPYRIDFAKLYIHKSEAKQIVSIGLPAGLQSSVFSISNVVIQSATNSFGTFVMAGRAAASNIEAFVNTAMDSFQHTTLTAVGQNYGAKKEKRIYKTIAVGLICAITIGVVLSLLVYIFGEFLLGLFIVESPEAIEAGMLYIIVCGLPFFIAGIMNVMTGALRGLGYSKIPALSSLIGVCGVRLLWVAFVLPLNRTVWMLFMCWPISWVVVSFMHIITFVIVRKKSMQKMYEM